MPLDDRSIGSPWSLLASRASYVVDSHPSEPTKDASQQVASHSANLEMASVDTSWSLLTKRSSLMRRINGHTTLNIDGPLPAVLSMIEEAMEHTPASYDPRVNYTKALQSGMESNLKPEVDGTPIGVDCDPHDQLEEPQVGCWLSMNCYKYSKYEGVNVCKYLCNSFNECKGFNEVRNSTFKMAGTCCFAAGSVLGAAFNYTELGTWFQKNCTTITVGSKITDPTNTGYRACEHPIEGNHSGEFWANQDRDYLNDPSLQHQNSSWKYVLINGTWQRPVDR